MKAIIAIALCLLAGSVLASRQRSSFNKMGAHSGPRIPSNKREVYIQNEYEKKVIEDQVPNDADDWTIPSNVYTADRNPEKGWTQLLLVLPDNNVQLFPFHKGDGPNETKYITARQDGIVSSQLFDYDDKNKFRWFLYQVEGEEPGVYQIVSDDPINLAMKANPESSDPKRWVLLVERDDKNKRQHWTFRDSETDEIVQMYTANGQRLTGTTGATPSDLLSVFKYISYVALSFLT